MRKSGVYYIDARIVLLQIVCVILLVIVGLAYWRWVEVTTAEFISPEFKSSLSIKGEEQIAQIADGVKKAKAIQGKMPAERYYLKLFSRKETRVYLFAGENVIYDFQRKQLLETPPKLRKILSGIIQELRLCSPFGELMVWDEVKYLFPQGVKAKVIDLDSGKSFQVQRQAGYNHADVKPLTAEDKKVIKEIYGGEWSWKRRAVVVLLGGRKVAASLSGMPHSRKGEGGGYFDLRFPLSGDRKDGDSLSYRIMYYKAAGKTAEMLREATPGETVLMLFTALDQKDWSTLKMILTSTRGVREQQIREIIGTTVYNIREKDELGYELLVSVSYRQGPYNDRRNVLVKLKRNEKTGYYQAEPEFLSGLLGWNLR